MSTPRIPECAEWRNGMVLEPSDFQLTDRRSASLAHIAALFAEPWPWGFTFLQVDEPALASAQLRVACEGVFPSGEPFAQVSVVQELEPGADGEAIEFDLARSGDSSEFSLLTGGVAVGDNRLPVARVRFRGGVWSHVEDWSPPVLFIGVDHPLRREMNRQLGALAALGAGFVATLRLPGAEDRPVARTLGHVAALIAQGVGVIEALLAAPTVSPGRIGLEALRLALGVRSATGIFEHLDIVWDPSDQRGSIRLLLQASEAAAAGIGLPFRASIFQAHSGSDILVVDGMPPGSLLLAIEASTPADLIAARSWFEGAALAAPERIREALTRRVSGCSRQPVSREPTIGISSGPLLALYQVNDDIAWRNGSPQLALAAEVVPPRKTSFSMLVVDGVHAGPPLLDGPTSGGGGQDAGWRDRRQ